VTLDDGTGAPSSALLTQVYAAIDAVRALTISFAVLPPSVVMATVSMVITVAPGYRKDDMIGLVASALLTYIDTLGIGNALAYTRLPQVAYSVPGVVNVQSVLLNGGASDIGGGGFQTVRATTSSVVVS
jgi:hypothetical protein